MEYPCSLALYNVDAALVFLDDWTIVMEPCLVSLVIVSLSIQTSEWPLAILHTPSRAEER